MKLNPSTNRGMGLIAAIIIVALFLVFIGTLTYIIIKAISRLPSRPSPEEESVLVEQAAQEIVAELQVQYPGEQVTVQAISVSYQTVFIPFGSNEAPMMIERSTNLVDWEFVASLGAGEVYADTNMFLQAFYRTTANLNTSQPAGFYRIQTTP